MDHYARPTRAGVVRFRKAHAVYKFLLYVLCIILLFAAALLSAAGAIL